MVTKKQLLLNSIRELLALNVSTEEILLNLQEVGIQADQAKQLIEEAKNPGKFAETAEAPEAGAEPEPLWGEGIERKKPLPKGLAEKIAEEREQVTEELASEMAEEEPGPEEIAASLGFKEESVPRKQAKPANRPAIEAKKPAEAEPVEAEQAEPELAPVEKELSAEEFLEGRFLQRPKKPREPDGSEQFPQKQRAPPEPYAASLEAGKGKPSRAARESRVSRALFEEEAPLQAASVEPRVVEDIKISKLWEKGILGTVNQRFSEMRELKRDIDSVLEKKIASATKRELDKIKVLFDSERSLLVSKVDAELEAKARELAHMIEAKLKELRSLSEQIARQTSALEDAERKSKGSGESLSKRLQELDKARDEMVRSFNSEMINGKSEIKRLAGEMNGKLSGMDERINKTLQLEGQIVEGLVNEAEQRIGQSVKEKESALAREAKKPAMEIAKLKESLVGEQREALSKMQAKFDELRSGFESGQSARLSKMDSQLKEMKSGFESVQGAKLAKVQSQLDGLKSGFDSGLSAKLSKMDSQFNSSMLAIDSQIKERLSGLERLQKSVSSEFKPEEFKRQMQELEQFKSQFVDAIKENAEHFNSGIRKLNEESQKMERQFFLRVEMIDKKMAELDNFEKNFAIEMGIGLDKLKKHGKN